MEKFNSIISLPKMTVLSAGLYSKKEIINFFLKKGIKVEFKHDGANNYTVTFKCNINLSESLHFLVKKNIKWLGGDAVLIQTNIIVLKYILYKKVMFSYVLNERLDKCLLAAIERTKLRRWRSSKLW